MSDAPRVARADSSTMLLLDMPDVAVAERTLPHNLEAERSVLGAILLHNDAFNLAAEVIDSRRFLPRRAPPHLRQDGQARRAQRRHRSRHAEGRARRARASSTRSAARPTSPRSSTACRARPTSSTTPRIIKEKATLRQPDLLGEQDPRDRVRRRGGGRRHPRPGRARDLRDRRRQGARRLRLAARPGAGAASTPSRSCTRARS